LYGTFIGGLRHLPPRMKNHHGSMRKKTLQVKKVSRMSACDVTCEVSLVY
jgi:hypothetical protein